MQGVAAGRVSLPPMGAVADGSPLAPMGVAAQLASEADEGSNK